MLMPELEEQTEEALGYAAANPVTKGMGYGELIVDNIIGLDNEYESFGEKLKKAVSEDEIGFLKNAAVGVYEGAKEFVANPIDTTTKVVTDIRDSIKRLSSEDLNTRLQNMYDVTYDRATDQQVNSAREAVLGDAFTALELIPAAKGVTMAAKAGSAGVKTLGDVAKRIEVDTSSMGSGLGNVRLKPKKIDETLNTSFSNPLEIGVSQASENGALLKSYTIDDVKSLDELSLSANAGTKKANSLLNAPVEDGTKVGIRLNLNSNIPNAPAGRNKLQTLHKKNFNGSPLSYRSHATVENVTFNVSQKGRTGIAARINKLDVPEAQNKFPAMSVDGNLTNSRNVLEEMGDDVVEIGFNPRNLHLFVDMNTGQAVKGAEVATVVGDRVYAKGVTYMKKTDAPKPLPASDGTELPSEVRYKFREGGAVPMDN